MDDSKIQKLTELRDKRNELLAEVNDISKSINDMYLDEYGVSKYKDKFIKQIDSSGVKYLKIHRIERRYNGFNLIGNSLKINPTSIIFLKEDVIRITMVERESNLFDDNEISIISEEEYNNELKESIKTIIESF